MIHHIRLCGRDINSAPDFFIQCRQALALHFNPLSEDFFLPLFHQSNVLYSFFNGTWKHFEQLVNYEATHVCALQSFSHEGSNVGLMTVVSKAIQKMIHPQCDRQLGSPLCMKLALRQAQNKHNVEKPPVLVNYVLRNFQVESLDTKCETRRIHLWKV